MASLQAKDLKNWKKGLKEHWQKPPTHFYEGNYTYGINFYQPMIDYLNAKKTNKNQDYPHLPWNDELALPKYSSRKVKNYSTEDLNQFRIEAEKQAKKDLDTFKIAKRSDFSLKKSVSAASLTKHVAQVTKDKVSKVPNPKHQAMADYTALESDLLHGALKSAEKYHITRSAKAIEGSLRFESMKNLSENTEVDYKSYQRQQAAVASSSVHDQREHTRVMETRRMQNDEVEQVMKPLDDLKHELKGFDKKTSHYFEEKSKGL